MSTEEQFREEPCFVISVAARIVGVHAQTLRHYERVGLIWPSRTVGRQRLYSMADIDRLRRLKALTEDMGLNLAGAEVALKLMNRIEELEGEVKRLTNAVIILQRQVPRQATGAGNPAERPGDPNRSNRSNPQGSIA
ncbi:MAG: MerR family transcriptional regulator [Chloroflexi bacterium]|nr:MerR family transcriptional regulator [Chloroflexota bacterium]